MRARITAIGCSVSGLAGLTGCSSAQELVTPTRETDDLAAAVEEVVGIPVTVTCPERIPLEAGRVCECVVSDGTLSKVLVVTQVDDQGNKDWVISEKDAPSQ